MRSRGPFFQYIKSCTSFPFNFLTNTLLILFHTHNQHLAQFQTATEVVPIPVDLKVKVEKVENFE